ncbi:MAG TPA: LPS export ABC transporter periplasmic protein LptC [Methylomirabilota bacterium]|jgi:LPS export ABC transporter protein LptC|nr:LPS export ABC transporter periplasmic protein LptC [Methylomirabilota bacterium]HWN01764.1 LPS export ABC transporter periplasmic protein LptC [Candidatus Dormibacteraeota bacterium]HWO04926.1 LPS export ABC transporter periplasmic protein LptC [Methylomirabilota bacterium]
MRKAPFIILTLVVVFLSVVVGVLVHRARIPRALTTEPVASSADYRLKQVHLQEQGRDGSRWQLDAEYSETFEEQNKTTMKKVTVKVDQPSKGDQGSRSWTVTGDEGDLNQETKNVELRGNVVLISSDGLRLETDRLRWDAEAQRAWTEDPVVIYRAGAVVRGTGFESKVAEEISSIKGRVRATFKKGTGVGVPALAGQGGGS